MRAQHRRWMALGLLAIILGVGVLLWMGRSSRTPKLPEVGLIRESLGQFLHPAGARGGVHTAFPADLNDDGETEAVAVFERIGSSEGEPSVWSDLKGRFEPLPVAIYPPPRRYDMFSPPFEEDLKPSGQMLVLRELIGWDPQSKQIVRTYLRRGRFVSEPVSNQRFQRFPTAGWVDTDEDDLRETLILMGERMPSLALRLNSEGRWETLTAVPADPSQSVNELQNRVSTVQTPPTGQTKVSTPAEFFYQFPRPTVLLPDGDGDGKPEQLRVSERVVRLSKGGAIPFPRPFKAGEQILIAELDGVAPKEILYASRADDPAKPGFYFWVYRLRQGKLQLIATHKQNAHYLALAVKDLDGDGRDEVITSIAQPPDKTRLTVWRFENGVFHEQTAEHPTNLDRMDDAHWLLTGRNTIVGETTHHITSDRTLDFGSENNSGEGSVLPFQFTERIEVRPATLLVGLPEGEYRANPKHWKTLAVDERTIWYGDHDSDGVEEYVLSSLDEGGAIAQFREGKWQLTPLKGGDAARRRLPSATQRYSSDYPRLFRRQVGGDSDLEVNALFARASGGAMMGFPTRREGYLCQRARVAG